MAAFLELFIIIFAQDVCRELFNLLYRRNLMKGRAVNLYGRTKSLVSILFGFSILALCVLIELGIDGQANTNAVFETRTLRPKRSVLLTHVSNWTRNEHLSIRPSELSLSDFPQLRKGKLECTERSEGYPRTKYFMVGDNECFDSEFSKETQLISVQSVERSNFVTGRLKMGERKDKTFSSKFGTISFRDGRAGHNETVRQLSIRFRVLYDGFGEYESFGEMTFSMLQNWNYSGSSSSNCSAMDTILSIYQRGNFFFTPETLVRVFCFTDVFQPAVVNDVTDLVPRPYVSLAPWFSVETYSLRPENIFKPKELVITLDEAELTAYKIFFALSKLHFVKENILTADFDYVPYLISQIDNRLSTEPSPSVPLRIYLPARPTTVVGFYSALCFLIAVCLLVLLKITFVCLKRKAPFEVRVFDPSYIASLEILEENAMQSSAKDSQGKYEVFMTLDQGRGAQLRMRRIPSEIEE